MVIRLNGVTKYYGSVKALDGITVSVRPGAIGLLGPNGAGKSTLIKALLGLVRLTGGEAVVLNHDARRESRLIRQKVGYMPEDDCHMAGLSGVESVAFAGELAGLPPRTALRRAHEMLDYVGIAEERYREVQTYSTGMRQKVKLAQAIIHAPKMLFLDEPTTGLDPAARDRMLRLIRSLSEKKGVTVVVSTHILPDVEVVCDSVLIVGRGKLLVYEDLKNLRQSVDNSFLVRIGGDRDAFLKAVWGRGCKAEAVGADEARVWGGAELVPEAVFASAREIGASVRQIEASRNSLEDIFLQAVSEGRNADL